MILDCRFLIIQQHVIPTKVGIHSAAVMDPRLRGDDNYPRRVITVQTGIHSATAVDPRVRGNDTTGTIVNPANAGIHDESIIC